jgi:hypothetical protein
MIFHFLQEPPTVLLDLNHFIVGGGKRGKRGLF